MLSYTLSEAIDLLSTKLSQAVKSKDNAIQVGDIVLHVLITHTFPQDLEFLREQITVMEVNTARVYNWDVKRRRERRQRGELTEATS